MAGAGISGLAACLGLARRGVDCTLLEKREAVGGQACVWVRDGVRLHPGVHLLHPSCEAQRPVVSQFQALMGGDCHVVRPSSSLYFLNRYLAFPLRTRELLLALGPLGMARVATSATAAQARTALARLQDLPLDDNFEAVVQGAFGDTFYRMFFRDYTAKVLGLDPRQIAGEWARRRVPMPSKRDFLQRVFPFYRPKTVEHAHPTFPMGQLTGHNGLDSLFNGILAQCNPHTRLVNGAELDQIHLQAGRIRALRWKTTEQARPADCWSSQRPYLISTIPLTDLVNRITPRVPEHVAQAASQLRFRGILYVYLEVSRPRLLNTHWTYYQSPDVLFNRLSEFGNIVPGAYGTGRTVVCAEITAQPGDALWESPAEALVAKAKEGLLAVIPGLQHREFQRCWVERDPYAYPVYDVDFHTHRQVVLNYVDSVDGLVCVGRQGRFDYLNMDECYAAGLAAATQIPAAPKEN